MSNSRKEVTEFDNYAYEFIGKDTPELRVQAENAKQEAIRLAKELEEKYRQQNKRGR